MTKEEIIKLIENEIKDINYDIYNIAYINGLIDMAYMTETITRQEKYALKDAAAAKRSG